MRICFIKEDIRMLQRTGAKLVSRAALFAWNSTTAEQVQKLMRSGKDGGHGA